jgi:hypothetical protein
MKCHMCHNELVLGSTRGWDERFNFGNSLPKGWLNNLVRFDCPKCNAIYLKLADGPLYIYMSSNTGLVWSRVKIITVRNIPKEKIIGGFFVQ